MMAFRVAKPLIYPAPTLTLTAIKLSQSRSARFILHREHAIENTGKINLALQRWLVGNPYLNGSDPNPPPLGEGTASLKSTALPSGPRPWGERIKRRPCRAKPERGRGRPARLPENPDPAPPIVAGRGGHHHGAGRGPARNYRPVRPRAAGPAIAPCAHRRAGIRSGGRHQQPDTQNGQFQFHVSPKFSGPTARLTGHNYTSKKRRVNHPPFKACSQRVFTVLCELVYISPRQASQWFCSSSIHSCFNCPPSRNTPPFFDDPFGIIEYVSRILSSLKVHLCRNSKLEPSSGSTKAKASASSNAPTVSTCSCISVPL